MLLGEAAADPRPPGQLHREGLRPQRPEGRLPEKIHHQRGCQGRGLLCVRGSAHGTDHELSLDGKQIFQK